MTPACRNCEYGNIRPVKLGGDGTLRDCIPLSGAEPNPDKSGNITFTLQKCPTYGERSGCLVARQIGLWKDKQQGNQLGAAFYRPHDDSPSAVNGSKFKRRQITPAGHQYLLYLRARGVHLKGSDKPLIFDEPTKQTVSPD